MNRKSILSFIFFLLVFGMVQSADPAGATADTEADEYKMAAERLTKEYEMKKKEIVEYYRNELKKLKLQQTEELTQLEKEFEAKRSNLKKQYSPHKSAGQSRQSVRAVKPIKKTEGKLPPIKKSPLPKNAKKPARKK